MKKISGAKVSAKKRQMAKINLFGGYADIIIYDIDPNIQEMLLEDITKKAKSLEKIFNFYDRQSELSILNSKRKIKASAHLVEVMKKSIAYSVMTKGSYDVTKGKQITARKNGEKIPELSCSFKDIKITGNMIELLHDDILIDLGSIAKGYITDRLAEYMKEIGIESAYMDSRGDLIIFGEHSEIVDIQHPRNKRSTIGSFILKDCAVATSGDYMQHNKTFSENHILGSKDIISATVISGSLAEADALATCAIVLGTSEAPNFLMKNNAKAFLIDKDMNKTAVNSSEEEWTKN